MRRYFAFLFFCVVVLHQPAQAQIINIENERFLNDSNGWIGRANLSFLLVQSVDQVLSFGSQVHVQWKNDHQRLLLLNDVALVSAPGRDFVNTGYQHVRWNEKLTDRLTWEAFVQAQYNKVLRLDFRGLMGTGPRLKLFKNEKIHLYVASLYMFEHEEITDGDPRDAHRLSSYLTFVWKINEHVSFAQTTFWQPNLGRFSDYRIAHDSSFGIDITHRLSFGAQFNLLYDTNQPEGVPALTYQVRNGIEWKF